MNPGRHLKFSIVYMLDGHNSIYNSIKAPLWNFVWDYFENCIHNADDSKISTRDFIENERDVPY